MSATAGPGCCARCGYATDGLALDNEGQVTCPECGRCATPDHAELGTPPGLGAWLAGNLFALVVVLAFAASLIGAVLGVLVLLP